MIEDIKRRDNKIECPEFINKITNFMWGETYREAKIYVEEVKELTDQID